MTQMIQRRLARGMVLAGVLAGLVWTAQAAERRPSGRPVTAPPVIGHGRDITLDRHNGFDFDTQQVTPNGPQTDVKVAGLASFIAFLSVPGAGFPTDGFGGEPHHGYAGCNSRTYVMGGNMRPVKPGQYYCMRTAEGRLAEFRVDSATGYADHLPIVVISYTLWEK